MAVIDGSSGVVPGATAPNYVATVIQFGAATKIEVLNISQYDDLWFAVNPAGNDFTANAPGAQFVQPREWIELAVSGSPIVVVKSVQPVRFQVRVVA